jgi:hypothetical protein
LTDQVKKTLNLRRWLFTERQKVLKTALDWISLLNSGVKFTKTFLKERLAFSCPLGPINTKLFRYL